MFRLLLTLSLGFVLTGMVWDHDLCSGPKHVVVYRRDGRFAGWPANHGIWAWGDEILVGFEAAYSRVQQGRLAIDFDKPEEHLLARSLDGGKTWAIEKPLSLLPPPSARVNGIPTELGGREIAESPGGIDFTHSGFAMTIRMTDINIGPSRFYYSYDRGHTWNGPYRVPDFGTKGVAARTDYIVDGPRQCTMFLTAAKEDGKEGRVMCVRTVDGGKTWNFVGWVSTWPEGFSIMPSSIRLSKQILLSAVRRVRDQKAFIELLRSDDNGATWQSISTVTPHSVGYLGNPPSMLRMLDGRLCVTYGHRAQPYGLRARVSEDDGRTWAPEVVLRDDGGTPSLGYTRTVQRTDGKLVTVYYYNERAESERIFIAATIWTPGRAIGPHSANRYGEPSLAPPWRLHLLVAGDDGHGLVRHGVAACCLPRALLSW